MIVDSSVYFAKHRRNIDVVVVGGGAIGIIAAVCLIRAGLETVLLEAGPASIDSDSQKIFKQAQNIGRPHRGLYEGRFRAFGGTTNFWGGQLVPLDPAGFTQRHWLKEAEQWPFARSEVELFYQKCYNLLGIHESLQQDENVEKIIGLTDRPKSDKLDYIFTRWLRITNFSDKFGAELRSSKNGTVVLNAPVIGINASGSGSVKSVSVRTSTGEIFQIDARITILANGTVEIIRLLLHDSNNCSQPPWKGNPWLGRGFSDHLEGPIASLNVRNKKAFHKYFDNIIIKNQKLQPRLRLSESLQAKDKLLSGALHIKFGDPGEHVQNAKIFIKGLRQGRFDGEIANFPRQALTLARIGMPMLVRYAFQNRIWSSINSEVTLRLMLEQEVNWDSQITLDGLKDKTGMYIPKINWMVDGEVEKRTIRRALECSTEFFEKNNLADVIPRSSDELYSLTEFKDTFHHMGGAKVGDRPEAGVVDRNWRVFGTQNLFVAGAATFASGTFSNPTFIAMALTMRLCEYIEKKMRDA